MKRLSFSATALALLVFTATVQAQTITDISGQYVNSSPEIGANTAGVVPVSGWNYITSGTSTSLDDSHGNSTGISVSTTIPYGIYKQSYAFIGGATGDADLFSAGALSTSSTPVVLSLSGLQAADTYTLIVYSMSNTQSAVEGTLTGGTTQWLKNPPTNYTSYTQGVALTQTAAVTGDYFEVTGITGVTGLTYSLSNQGGAFGDIPGFQLIQSTPSESVPEPSTVWLMGLGCVGLLIYVRRKRVAQS